MFVDTTDYYPKCASDRWISYTLKENFTSSRLLKNENYTYLKLNQTVVLHKCSEQRVGGG